MRRPELTPARGRSPHADQADTTHQGPIGGSRLSGGGFRLGFVAYMRTVTTGSGATAVQIVWKSVHGSRDIKHVGSAHSPAEVEVLKAAAVQRIAAGQDPLPLDQPAAGSGPGLQVVGMRMGLLLDAIAEVYRRLGLDKASGGDLVFEHLVTARIIEPSSKQDAARVLTEAGIRPLSYRTVKRRLPVYAEPSFRHRLS